MQRKILVLLILILLFSFSFAAYAGCNSAGVCRNTLAYASGSDYYKFDLYLPTNSAGPWPVIVFIHPGSWAAGSKDDVWNSSTGSLNWPFSDLVNNGYAFASINYHLTEGGKYPFPIQVYDAKAAVRYLRANASTWNINPNKIGTWGWSAGGHQATMLAVTGNTTTFNGSVGNYLSTSSAVQSAVVLVGPTFVYPILAASNTCQMAAFYGYLGGDPATDPVAATRGLSADASQYVNAGDAPILLQHGHLEQLVPKIHGSRIANAYTALGMNGTAKVYDGTLASICDHESFDFYPDTLAFFQKTLPATNCNNNNVCDFGENAKVCASDCPGTITSSEVYCARWPYAGKLDTIKLWNLDTYAEIPEPRWVCASNRSFYGCASSAIQAEIDWWKSWSTLAANNQVVDNLFVCNLSTQRWVSQCTESDWACTTYTSCNENNTKTRTCTKTNTSCLGGVTHSATETSSCTYVPPACTESNWTYTNGNCLDNNTLTQTWTKSGNCSGGVTHTTPQTISCVYNAPTCTSFTYSNWSACNSTGQQTRTIISTTPAVCNGGNSVLSQPCTRPCVDSDWNLTITPNICPASESQLQDWSKINTCEGGIIKTDTNISCTYTNTDSNNELDNNTNNTDNNTDTTSGTGSTTGTSSGNTSGSTTLRVCIESDWNSLTDTYCSSSGTKSRYWEKVGNCSGGVTHPVIDTITCTPTYSSSENGTQDNEPTNETPQNNEINQSNSILCTDNDWISNIEPEDCPASGKQIKYWTKKTSCIGGTTRPSFEIIECQTENNNGNIVETILGFFKNIFSSFFGLGQ